MACRAGKIKPQGLRFQGKEQIPLPVGRFGVLGHLQGFRFVGTNVPPWLLWPPWPSTLPTRCSAGSHHPPSCPSSRQDQEGWLPFFHLPQALANALTPGFCFLSLDLFYNGFIFCFPPLASSQPWLALLMGGKTCFLTHFPLDVGSKVS